MTAIQGKEKNKQKESTTSRRLKFPKPATTTPRKKKGEGATQQRQKSRFCVGDDTCQNGGRACQNGGTRWGTGCTIYILLCGGAIRGHLMSAFGRGTLTATLPAVGLWRIFALHSTTLTLTKKGSEESEKGGEMERSSKEEKTHLHVRSRLPLGGCRQAILRFRQK